MAELELGRAGEYLAMADLLLKGEKCFMTDQGINYDLVVERTGKLLRCQVKTTTKPMLNDQRYAPIYHYHIKRAGKSGKREYSINEFDLFALVALDLKAVFYLPFDDRVASSICVRDRNVKYKGKASSGGRPNGLYYQDLTWEACLKDMGLE